MLQTLFRIPNEVAGLPVFGFGLLLAAWTAFSLGLIVWLIRKQGFNHDTRSYLPVLLVIGAAIWLVLPRIADDVGLPIRGYGVMLLVAVVAGVGLAVWRARRVGVDAETVFSIAFWGFIPGILGARLFYVIEYWPRFHVPGDFAATLARVANVAEGGLVVYGSIFGGIAGTLAYIAIYRLPLLAMLDLLAPSLMLGMAIGRLGCFLNGCCFGAECELPWSVRFPWASPASIHQVEHGATFVHGMRIPAHAEPDAARVAAVAAGSAAARAGVAPGAQIVAVNGRAVGSAREADWLLLHADRAEILFRTTSAGEEVAWPLEAHPHLELPASPAETLAIDGVTLADARPFPVVRAVRAGSAAARRGVSPGQQWIALSGRPVPSLAEGARLIDEHAHAPWIALKIAGRSAPVVWTIQQPLPASLPVHPTQLYSALNDFLICLFLLTYAPFRRRDGELSALTLTLYPVTRFLVEIIRTDESAVFGTGLSISQNVSVLVLAVALALWVWVLTRPAATAFPKAAV